MFQIRCLETRQGFRQGYPSRGNYNYILHTHISLLYPILTLMELPGNLNSTDPSYTRVEMVASVFS